jgi:copper resistance protein B
MTSPLKLTLLAAAATVLPAVPAAAQAQQPATPPATGTTCLPEHAAMGHCTLPADPAPQAQPAPQRQPGCLPEHAAMGHCTLPAPQPAPKAQPAPQPQTSCLPEHAAMGHCTLPAQPAPQGQATPAPQPQSTCLPEHAAMGHCTLPAPQPAPQSTCLPEHAAMGHCTPAPQPATRAGAEGTDLPAGNAPPPPVPADNAADAVYGAEAMHMGRHHLQTFHGGQKLFQALINIAEVQFHKGKEAFEWDAEGWYGGDINRLWIKTEGEGEFGRSIEKADVQALYSHAVDPYFNIQGGIRYDVKPNPSRVYATVGFEGLAPSFFDVEGALFLSNKGELMARAEGYYDQRITQRLILQPRAELNFAAQSSREIGVGKGLSDAEIGLRLRYDIRREFAPYVGVQYRRAFGDTRRFLRAEGEDASSWSLLTGVRLWF